MTACMPRQQVDFFTNGIMFTAKFILGNKNLSLKTTQQAARLCLSRSFSTRLIPILSRDTTARYNPS